jgi:diguanylate cyclase (GGDEF)-like protein
VATGGLRAASLLDLAVALLLLGVLANVVVRELGPEAVRTPVAAFLQELEVGVVLLTAVYVLLALTGGLRSFLYPLLYALVSFLSVVQRRRSLSAVILGTTALLEGLLLLRDPRAGAWGLAGTHVLFASFFAAGNGLILSGLARRMRRAHGQRIEEELERMRAEARDFRLIAAQLPLESRSRRREDEELRMAQASVESIHEQLFHALDLLRTSLGLHSCVILWVDGAAEGTDGRATPPLKLKEIATASDASEVRPRLENPGLLAGVLRDPKPLRLHALGGRRVPPYYAGPEAITDLCAVPILEGANLRGLLCADRRDDRPFSDADLEALVKAARQILRVVEHERVFTAVERGKYEQEQFYRASELLNQALTCEDVYAKTFLAVRAIAPFDLGVLVQYDSLAGRHRVLATDAAGADAVWADLARLLGGREFSDGPALVAMAVKNRHHLPAGGEFADPECVVFDPETRVRAARSLLVLPLLRGEQVLGTLVLASARPHAWSGATCEMLRVIGHQVAVSLQNADMYRQMEERATTDGLTGLTNRRAFQERLAHLHALAERTGQKFSLILTDIDHFKSINDTYGHPVGDAVLRNVAAVLASRSRKVDIVARYGGEEFVLVLPDTDGEGAAHFANKLREEIAAQVMTSEHGPFHITMSMGVAEYPPDGRDRQELVQHADEALYYCKEHGRNRVTRWAQMA